MVTKSKILGFHPIDIYCARPSNMAQYTFCRNPTLRECEDGTHTPEMETWGSSGTPETS
jgi:hypothetical protein